MPQQQQSKPLAKSIAKTVKKYSSASMDDATSTKPAKKVSGADLVIKSKMATNKTMVPKKKK
jgi:hypothetical protein